MAEAATRMSGTASWTVRADGVLRLTLNRPAARNALSIGLMTALIEALDEAAGDRECRVVVIAAAGPAFCAGHDLRELRERPAARGLSADLCPCAAN